eukprot:scaffold6480_cov165-Amphora_coffeaeformis.AAC.6
MNVQANPLAEQEDAVYDKQTANIKILFEDDYMVVVDKPHDMLSVPGRHVERSVYTVMKERYPHATGPLLVHRLDMSTSGLLLVAKDAETHKQLQKQFIQRTVQKRYTALLEGEYDHDKIRKGTINFPLGTDYLNRPMQKVDWEDGKAAVTEYEILDVSHGRTRVHFFPHTGRTHQLRVHAAHPLGLDLPIVGDDIYGQREERLCLHAGYLQVEHPVIKERMTFVVDDPF